MKERQLTIKAAFTEIIRVRSTQSLDGKIKKSIDQSINRPSN